jgi:hypothetical protein
MTLNKNNFYFFLIIFFSLFFNYFGYDEAWIYYVTNNIYYHASDNDFSNIPFSSLVGKSFMWAVRSLSLLNYFNDFFFLNRFYSFFSIIFSFIIICKILKKNFHFCNNYFFISYSLFTFWFCFHEGGMTSRYDAQVTFLCVFFIFTIFEYNNKKAYFVISTIINFILILYHPNLIPLILVNFFFIYLFFFKKKKKLFYFLIVIFLCLIFFNKDYLIKLLEFYNSITSHYYDGTRRSLLDINLYLENIRKDILFQGRFKHLYNFYPFTFYILIFNYFLIFIHLIWIRDFKNKHFNFVLFLFFLWNIFFLLSPTKWSHHFAIIFALLSLILPFLLFSLVEKINSILKTKISLKIFSYINLILIFLISLKSLYYFNNNYFLFKFLDKYFEVNHYNLFSRLSKNEIIIQTVNDKMRNKTFYGNPEFKYIFDKANYLGNNSNKIKETPDFFVVYSRFEKCEDYVKTFNSKYIFQVSFNINDSEWIVCEKSN